MTKILLRIFQRSITASVLTTTVNIVLPVVKKKGNFAWFCGFCQFGWPVSEKISYDDRDWRGIVIRISEKKVAYQQSDSDT
jgi:hypothetical protein